MEGQRFTVKLDNDPIHTTKETLELLGQRDIMLLNGIQTSDINSLEHAFISKDKREGRKPHKRTATESICSTGLAKKLNGGNSVGNVHVQDFWQRIFKCRGFASEYKKYKIYYVSLSNYF